MHPKTSFQLSNDIARITQRKFIEMEIMEVRQLKRKMNNLFLFRIFMDHLSSLRFFFSHLIQDAYYREKTNKTISAQMNKKNK